MRVGTDCSGMNAPVVALRGMGIDVTHVFACECDKACKTRVANHTPSTFYDNITTRDHTSTPSVDFYAAGFPCFQTFSTMGRRAGREGDRGRIFDHVHSYIKSQRPSMFLLENVSNIVKISKGQVFSGILNSLEELGYDMHCTWYSTHRISASRSTESACISSDSKKRIQISRFLTKTSSAMLSSV